LPRSPLVADTLPPEKQLDSPLKFISVLFLALAASSVLSADRTPPNIVLILSDDQSYTDYGFMGHDAIETPNLDRLASESALFRRGYVPTALCRPALMTIATGLYSHQNLTTGNDPDETTANQAHAAKAGKDIRELLISHIDKTGSLPRWLAKKGYVSHQSGKWWEGSFERGGFTEGMTRGFPHPRGRHGDDGLKIGREGMDPVLDFIDRASVEKKPFFVWYAPFMPHTPHNPPQRLFEKYAAKGLPEEIAKYYAMCEWFDETCGTLLDHLDKSGIGENTLVVYVADNGWIQSEQGGYEARSKRSPHEGGIRTPIMFRWLKTIPAADRPELCSSIDIVPTILAAAGAEPPHQLPGLNLLPQLKNGKAINRNTIYGESFAHDIADTENPSASLLYRWVIRDHTKLLLTYDGAPGKMKYPPTGGQAQLFNLKIDPQEKTNLAADQPKLVSELSQLLEKWYSVPDRKVGIIATTKPIRANNESKNTNRAAAATKRPNILLLFADDQRNDTLGVAGHPIVKTPSIDRLATNGVRFTNAFVTTSTCWVSRASLFTGTSERRHLYRVTPGPLNPDLCDTSYFTVLKNAGYRTGHIGKEHVDLADASAQTMFDVRRPLFRRPYFKEQADGSLRHTTQILGDWGIEFLEEQPQDQPFCLTVSFNATHAEDGDKRPGIGHFPWPKVMDGYYEDQEMPLPQLNDPAIYESQPNFLKQSINRERFFWRWDTPEKYQTNMRAYFRMLSGIDHVVGRLVDQLEKQGLADNTVIIYTADNGYYLGDRGFAGKWTHYDQSLRIPMIVYDPRLPADSRGRVLPQMVLNSDLASTMIELGGETPPPAHTGRSLVPLTRGQTPADWRTDFLCEFIAIPQTIPRWEGVRGGDYTYARYYVDGPEKPPFEFLHDLKNDPNQLVNLTTLAASEQRETHREALSKLRQRCDALIAESGPMMKDIPPEAPRVPANKPAKT